MEHARHERSDYQQRFPAAGALPDPTAWLSLREADGTRHPGLHGCSTERTLQPHEHLYVAGERRRNAYLVLDGVVGVYALLADGRRQIVSFAYPGDLLGMDGGGSYGESAEALAPARVLAIGSGAIDRLIAQEPGFGRALLQRAAAELTETRERMLSLGRRSAVERLAGFLLRVSRRAGQGDAQDAPADVITLPMRRGDIADFLGLTVETISRNMTRLRVARVIRLLSHHGEIEILDRARLEAIAAGGEDPTRH